MGVLSTQWKALPSGAILILVRDVKSLTTISTPYPIASVTLWERLDLLKKRPVVIGEGCFLGANSIILKGTTLGKNVVVGAGSVVSGTFPDNVIIAGNPARIIKDNRE